MVEPDRYGFRRFLRQSRMINETIHKAWNQSSHPLMPDHGMGQSHKKTIKATEGPMFASEANVPIALDVTTLFITATCITALLGLLLLSAWAQERIRALAWWGTA